MTPKDYIKNVLVTEARDFSPLQERFSKVRNIRLLHGAIGLASELAEISCATSAEEIDATNVLEEMGDLLWYTGIMIDELGLDADHILNVQPYLERNDYNDKRDYFKAEASEMVIAVGEGIDLLKKSLMYGKDLNVEKLGNCLLSLNLSIEAVLNLYGFVGAQARARNIEKLRARYGEKFTEAAALERDLAKERAILEQKV